MSRFKVFVSTCRDVDTLYKAREKCIALDSPNKWSDFSEIKADNLEDAFQVFYKTDIFNEFIDNNSGEIFRYYLEDGAPVLYEQ